MKHLFISYELALIAKEKGFNDRCLASINPDGQIEIGNTSYLMAFMKREKKDIFAPTHQQIVDWFRKKHDIVVSVFVGRDQHANSLMDNKIYFPEINNSGKEMQSKFDYYEALNKAIEEAFKLI